MCEPSYWPMIFFPCSRLYPAKSYSKHAGPCIIAALKRLEQGKVKGHVLFKQDPTDPT